MTTLLQAVARVESSGNQFAIRREPTLILSRPVWLFGENDVNFRVLKEMNGDLTEDGAIYCCCSSFGLYQILGGNLYGEVCHLKAGLLDYLCDSSLQDTTATLFMASLGFRASMDMKDINDGTLLLFASKYNGPGQPAVYAENLRKVSA